jgi:alkanesulfonate monooxygenase SsuD/methylene tetrahydromethanopterin reductase-like flavin-dependent oxidoreductase (luciferase family)
LSYIAGRTERIDVGTMVTVLPWHDPIRLAENISLLQHMLGPDRKAILGFGRGLSRREFGALGLDMESSRERFTEALAVMRKAYEGELFDHEGEFFNYKGANITPEPLDRGAIGEAYGVWTSKDSMMVAAKEGLHPLTIPAKSLADFAKDIAEYDELRAGHGFGPSKRPILQMFMYCAPTEDEAREYGEKYIIQMADVSRRHYEIGGEHFDAMKGYESYQTSGVSGTVFKGGSVAQTVLNDAMIGTPEQCVQKVREVNELMGPAEVVAVSAYGAMPAEDAEKSLRLFAAEALPEIQKIDPASSMAVVG